jgi:hypothetical protein
VLTIIVRKTYEVAPGVLTEHGKVSGRSYTMRCAIMIGTSNRLRIRGPMLTLPPVRLTQKNPSRLLKQHANIGCVLYHYGLTEFKVP